MLCRRGYLRSPSHWYLLNLVVSDILTCLLCVPFTVVRLTLKDWRLGELLCRTAPFLQLTYVFVSIFTILAIAVERYRSIVFPAAAHAGGLKTTRQRLARLLLPAIWLLAMGLATPLAVTHRLEPVPNVTGRWGEDEEVLTLCVEHWESEAWLGAYTVLLLLFQYLLPAAAIMALHLLICRFLRARTRVHLRGGGGGGGVDSSSGGSSRCREKLARHRKNLILLTVISITFDLQWLPITVVNILADFHPTVFPSARHFCLTYSLCLLFALTSVFSNPIVYGWYNSNFRRDLSRNRTCSTRAGTCEWSGSVLTGRRNSEALSRLYSVVGRSTAPSSRQHCDSAEDHEASATPLPPPLTAATGGGGWVCGGPDACPTRPHLRNHSSVDVSSGGCPAVRRESRAVRAGQRRSLQLELK